MTVPISDAVDNKPDDDAHVDVFVAIPPSPPPASLLLLLQL